MAIYGVGQRVRVADGRSLYNGFIGKVVSVVVPGNRGSYVSYFVKLEFWDKPCVRLGQKQLEALAEAEIDRDIGQHSDEETTSQSSNDDRRTAFDARSSDGASHVQDSLEEERTATDFAPMSLPSQLAGMPPVEPDSQIDASSDLEPTPVLDRSLAQQLVNRGISDIGDLSLQPRTYNALRKNGIRTVFDLAGVEERDLLRLHQFGFKSLVELKMRLAAVELADDSIYCLNLSTFVVHALVRNGIRTISGVRALSDEQLFGLRGFGHSSLIELQEKLKTYTPRESEPLKTGSESVILEGETIYLLNLKPRTFALLWRNRIRTISALTAMTDEQLLSICGFGPHRLVDVKSRLKGLQLSLQKPDQESKPSSPALSHSQSYQESICRIRELASHLCQHFANQGLHEQLTLPERLENIAFMAFDEPCRTLLDLHQLTEQPDLNSSLADRPYAYSRGYALKEILDWLETAVRYRTIDDELGSFVAGLNKRETAVLLNRFRLDGGLTLEAIGSQFGITRERVRQIQKIVKVRLVRRASLSPLFYSRAALLLLKRMDDEGGVTFESWKRRLIDTGYLEKDESLDLLIAISLARASSSLFLSKEQVASMRLGLPHGVIAHVKPLLKAAHAICRRCGAVRAMSLVSEELSEANVGRVLSSGGFAEIYPGWWTTDRVCEVPRRIAMKVVAHCGPVPVSTMRHCLRRHLWRFRLPAPPSEVMVKALEQTGEFAVDGALIRLARPLTKNPPLTGPERIFVQMVRSQGPIVSFESTYEELTKAGFSVASVAKLLAESPIVHKVASKLYTLVGTLYDRVDVERAESELTRVSLNPTLRPRSDGIVEFESNIGNFAVYGGILGCGPAAQMKGTWTLIVAGKRQGELLIQGAFIQNLEPARDVLGLVAGDRIKIEFNTWTREATVRKVTTHDKA